MDQIVSHTLPVCVKNVVARLSCSTPPYLTVETANRKLTNEARQKTSNYLINTQNTRSQRCVMHLFGCTISVWLSRAKNTVSLPNLWDTIEILALTDPGTHDHIRHQTTYIIYLFAVCVSSVSSGNRVASPINRDCFARLSGTDPNYFDTQQTSLKHILKSSILWTDWCVWGCLTLMRVYTQRASTSSKGSASIFLKADGRCA